MTSAPDPKDAASSDAEEAPPSADAPPADGTDEEPKAPGVGQAVGGVRAAFMRMLDAHVALLRAEMESIGKEVAIIAGLAVGIISIAILVGILLYVGSFLFFGELLFGSMGWGIIHGTLLGVALVGLAAVNLGGGEVRSYGFGAAIGVVVTVVLAALLLSNVGNEGGEAVSRWFRRELVPDSDLPFGPEWTTTLSGLLVGAVIGAVVALVASWRSQLGHPFAMLMIGLVAGGFVGALYVSTRYDAVDGVMGMAIMVGLLTWIVAGLALAARKGFDPEARYANLIPTESITAFGRTKEFLTEQWEQQKNRMMGR